MFLWIVMYQFRVLSVLPIKSQRHIRPFIKKYHNIACEIVENFIIKEGSQFYYMNDDFLQFCV